MGNEKVNNSVIVVMGPTASGKTALAIEMAEYLETEIISADSRQCFKELNIGVARPTEKELNTVRHYFIASHSVTDVMNASVFEQYALAKCDELFQRNRCVVMVGGTGLYLRAFCRGLDDIPPVDPEIRERIIHNYENKGLQWLQEQVERKDPGFFKAGEVQNPQRMMRALEVMEATGHSILSFHKGEKSNRDFKIIKIGLELSREELHRNIHTRVDNMMEKGLPDEVKGLVPYQHLNALQTVGYSELFEYLGGRITLPEAVEKIKINTRQYARRQMTWFRKEKDINWVRPDDWESIKELLS